MVDKNDILTFRLHGNGVTPTSFKGKEVAEVLLNLEEAIKHYVQHNDDGYEGEDLYISLVGVQDQSLSLKLSPNVGRFIVPAFAAISLAVSTDNYNNTPQQTLDNLKSIQRVIISKGCLGTFYHNGAEVATISPDTTIKISENVIIKGETVIYGEVKRVGGQKPKVRLQTQTGQTISCDVTEKQAKRLAERLYESVGLVGIASWNRTDYSIIDFKVTKVSDYDRTSNSDAFKNISDIVGKYWNNIDNIDNIDDALLK